MQENPNSVCGCADNTAVQADSSAGCAGNAAMDDLRQALHYTKENNNILLLGRIPCVVQVPFQEYLDKKLRDRSLYNIALADFGAQWLIDSLKGRNPNVVMGTGVEGMVGNPDLIAGSFKSLAGDRLDNPDFLPFHDPNGRFDILTGIPLVMVVDESLAAGRPLPQAFSDLLDPMYEKSIVYPDDGAMLNGLLMMYVAKAAGMDGVRSFRRNVICGVHPSQMIKPGALKPKPFIMLMPWIFARIKSQQRNMKMIWFSDGVPFLPLCVTGKDNDNARRVYDILCDPEAGKVLRKNGFFPAASSGVSNDLPGKLQFVGWDIIYSPDLLERIAACKELMKAPET